LIGRRVYMLPTLFKCHEMLSFFLYVLMYDASAYTKVFRKRRSLHWLPMSLIKKIQVHSITLETNRNKIYLNLECLRNLFNNWMSVSWWSNRVPKSNSVTQHICNKVLEKNCWGSSNTNATSMPDSFSHHIKMFD